MSDVGFREGTAPSLTVHAWYATRPRSPPASRIQLPAPGTVLVLTTVTFAGVAAPHMIVWKRASIVMLTNVRTAPSSGNRTERYVRLRRQRLAVGHSIEGEVRVAGIALCVGVHGLRAVQGRFSATRFESVSSAR